MKGLAPRRIGGQLRDRRLPGGDFALVGGKADPVAERSPPRRGLHASQQLRQRGAAERVEVGRFRRGDRPWAERRKGEFVPLAAKSRGLPPAPQVELHLMQVAFNRVVEVDHHQEGDRGQGRRRPPPARISRISCHAANASPGQQEQRPANESADPPAPRKPLPLVRGAPR